MEEFSDLYNIFKTIIEELKIIFTNPSIKNNNKITKQFYEKSIEQLQITGSTIYKEMEGLKEKLPITLLNFLNIFNLMRIFIIVFNYTNHILESFKAELLTIDSKDKIFKDNHLNKNNNNILLCLEKFKCFTKEIYIEKIALLFFPHKNEDDNSSKKTVKLDFNFNNLSNNINKLLSFCHKEKQQFSVINYNALFHNNFQQPLEFIDNQYFSNQEPNSSHSGNNENNIIENSQKPAEEVNNPSSNQPQNSSNNDHDNNVINTVPKPVTAKDNKPVAKDKKIHQKTNMIRISLKSFLR